MLHMTCIICYNSEVDVIKSFRDKETEKIYRGYKSLKLEQSIQRVAYRKLKMLNNAFELMINIGSVFDGKTKMFMMLKLWITNRS